MTIAIITVTEAEDAGRIDAEDADVAGSYAVALGDGEGEHPAEPRNPPAPGDDPLVEAALDAFHGRIAIGTLDQFDIGVAILADGEKGPEDAHWL